MYRPLYGHILWFLRVEWPDHVVHMSVFKNLQIGRQHPIIVFCTFCQQSLRAPVSMSLPIHSSAVVGIFVFSIADVDDFVLVPHASSLKYIVLVNIFT